MEQTSLLYFNKYGYQPNESMSCVFVNVIEPTNKPSPFHPNSQFPLDTVLPVPNPNRPIYSRYHKRAENSPFRIIFSARKSSSRC